MRTASSGDAQIASRIDHALGDRVHDAGLEQDGDNAGLRELGGCTAVERAGLGLFHQGIGQQLDEGGAVLLAEDDGLKKVAAGAAQEDFGSPGGVGQQVIILGDAEPLGITFLGSDDDFPEHQASS